MWHVTFEVIFEISFFIHRQQTIPKKRKFDERRASFSQVDIAKQPSSQGGPESSQKIK
jgi:hypothetical protein